ncbi:glycoside hydrolase family 17 protein, partial [Cercospora zeae-maydis SCOH1-5]
MLSSTLSLLALAGAASAQVRGFNYGALYADNRARQLADWEADFRAAQDLPGVGGFNSARLFTMIQGYSNNEIISALPAAVSTNTSLLLGIWCSGGEEAFSNELTALRNAITQFGDQLKPIGLSIGSEDLYRISPTGIENESGPGAQPDQLVNYIQRAREVLQGTAWADVQIGHVDTWTAYVNGSNNAVIEALDWVGVDAYPYFQTVNENSIENAPQLFFDALQATEGAAQGKPVWVTETGWPVTGPASGLAVSGTEDA